MSNYVLILASGTGSRAGGSIPKQFRHIAGRPLFYWSVRAFAAVEDVRIIAVVHPDYISLWREYWEALPASEYIEHRVVAGGASRIESVKCGLSVIPFVEGGETMVAVHDAARPMVTPEMIKTGFLSCSQYVSVAVPAVAMSDSLRRIKGEDLSEGASIAVDRSAFVAVQTPQIAPLRWLRDAYTREMQPWFTDDASILEAAGYNVRLYAGEAENFKVTTPGDFLIADSLLTFREKNMT
ncbi:MAG: 2-C-methyl-D-erythritol 4-phosphate cytidylyltransferase [Bacteroidales bacterium]|nr:2-C-methyl-D-erythritol 4-phosphate cytidylyltransferase [Bacteroidales bacterium]